MPEPQRVVAEQDPDDPLVTRFRVVLEEHTRPPEEPAPAPTPPPPPAPQRIREAHIGPIDIRVDMEPFMKVLNVLMKAYSHLVELLTGPELLRIMEELAEGKREPINDFERSVLRAIRGATRFERINENLK